MIARHTVAVVLLVATVAEAAIDGLDGSGFGFPKRSSRGITENLGGYRFANHGRSLLDNAHVRGSGWSSIGKKRCDLPVPMKRVAADLKAALDVLDGGGFSGMEGKRKKRAIDGFGRGSRY